LLSRFTQHPGHHFWPDDISLLDRQKIDLTRLLSASQITDSYLLALAIGHGGQLATLDRRLIPDAVRHGAQALHLIR
jgi:predicted nucleic acid-binding protein